MADTLSRSTEIAAPAEKVWALVSDLPAMGEYSPENAGGRWLKGATGPGVGVGFKGSNSRGARRWSTLVTVVTCDPGRAFAFEVSSVGGLAVARWSYDLTSSPGGCTLTESWQDRRGVVIKLLGRLVSGEGDREGFTAQSMEQTLARVKARAESD